MNQRGLWPKKKPGSVFATSSRAACDISIKQKLHRDDKRGYAPAGRLQHQLETVRMCVPA